MLQVNKSPSVSYISKQFQESLVAFTNEFRLFLNQPEALTF